MLATATGAPRISFEGSDTDYRPGACNIGRAEIRRRWRTGHLVLLFALALYAVLVLVHAPALVRCVIAAPVAVSAACYLEAALKFCVRFGMMGLFNFGALGAEGTVADLEARARDRRRAVQLSAASLVIALLVGAVAVLLPF
jgi:hypothetical protein